MGTLYLLYFLRDQVHYKHPAQGLFILIAIYTGFVIITAIVGGVISDRIGKRKMIVTVSGILMGAAALLLTFVETWPAAMVAAVLFGAGFGAYLAVDQALITQVLPAAKDRAKDLGIINIAIVGPAAVAGAIAAVLVSLGGYPALFAATAVVAAIGIDPGLADQERSVAARTGPRPTRAIWRLWATRLPAESQTSASSSNQPPLTCLAPARRRASRPGAGTIRMCMVSSTVGAQPVAPSPNTTGGRPSTASASISASGSRSSRRPK